MGLLELFLAVVLVGLAALNASVAGVALRRTRDPRFGLVAGADGAAGLLGLLWAIGAGPTPPPWAPVPTLVPEVLVLWVVLLLLVAGLWPRRG